MFERVVDLSLRNRGAVLFFTAVVGLVGWWAFRGLTIEAFPDPTDTQVNVITLFPGQPAEEVERQIGLPLERALNGTPGLIRLRNLSLFGLSYVTLTFADDVDPLFARSQTLERLRGVDLPPGVEADLGPLATPIGEVYRYTLEGAGGDPMRLRTVQDWVVRPRLLRVLGVADVVSYGGLVREIHVQPSPARLAAFGLTLEDLEVALRKGSVNASGGVLEHGAEQFVIRSQGLFRNLADIGAVHVASRDGTPVRVRDVASVRNGWTPRQGVVSRGDHFDAVQGIVLMRRGENPSEVLARIRHAVAELDRRLGPEGIRIAPFYDRTDLVNTTLRTVGRNLLEGATFVTLVLFVFLLDLRAALICATVIPLSLLSAFIYLKLRGMSANLLSPTPHRDSPVLRLAERAYGPALRVALRRPGTVLIVSVLALVVSVHLLSRLGSEFLPELNEGSLYLTFTLPPNTSLTEGRRLVPRITELLRSHPEVQEVLTQLGRPEDGTDPKLANNLEVFLLLKPPEQWRRELRSLGDVIEDIRSRLVEIPGVEINFSQPIRDNVNESISGQQGQIALKLYGDDLIQLQDLAERAKAVLAAVPGVADLGIVKSSELPQIKIEPDREALARYGLDMEDFQHVLQAALGGQPVEVFWDGEARFDIVLRYPPSARADIEKIRNLQVPVQGGSTVPLEMLARVAIARGRAAISRENGRRYIGIRMNVRGRDMGSFVDEARATVARAVPLPAGVSSERGGEFESKERAMHRLTMVVPVALLLTLVLLFHSFGRFSPAVLVLLNTPFALVGGVLALWWAELPLSVSAAVGFIALIGQASLNGVLVLSRIEEKRAEGMALDRAIVEGCAERLRPVLMTASLAALGLVPAAMSHAIGSEVQRPVAVVIVGGTMSAALLTLIVLPAMYRVWTRRVRA